MTIRVDSGITVVSTDDVAGCNDEPGLIGGAGDGFGLGEAPDMSAGVVGVGEAGYMMGIGAGRVCVTDDEDSGRLETELVDSVGLKETQSMLWNVDERFLNMVAKGKIVSTKVTSLDKYNLAVWGS